MYLQFDYQMKLFYSLPVSLCHFTIKCIPKDTVRQRLLHKEILLYPETKYSMGEDSYGNKMIYGCIEQPHDSFVFKITGKVEIFPADYEEKMLENRVGMYRYPFGKCIPGETLSMYFDTLGISGISGDYEKCIYLMHRLHQDFVYAPLKTEVTTDAEEAWKLGMGVCQDYAHIYIVLLRMAGIPARYVCGLLVGEGKSHAWVEALCEGKWIGFDPTNDCQVSSNHIKLGDGRDATECAINRGIMLGGGGQTQEITAMVTGIEQ
ncbi:MAG: transglutaminase domain-containing protein [Butyrivibrio sp.]